MRISPPVGSCWFQFLVFGLGWSSLFFRRSDGKKELLLPTGVDWPAFLCPHCEAIVAHPERKEPSGPSGYVPENLY